jgi:Ser/Thr protein kinase RdoA (MazF antagonist)
MENQLEQLVSQFEIKGSIDSVKAFGSGLINSTYEVNTDTNRYILQKVNHNIFPNVEKLTENIERVTSHIREKVISAGGDISREVLTIVPTKEGKGFYKAVDGTFWRIFDFIRDSKTYDKLETAEQAFEGGKVFGNFHVQIADLPGDPLFEVIPNFHNVEMRLETFKSRIDADPVGRVKEVQEEIDFLMERAEDMKRVVKLGKEGKMPLRTIHNDTKFSNALLDENDKALCAIDLDTVMPGYLVYDFGDAIRSSTNTGAEDDVDLSKVSMNLDLYRGFAQGFLSQTKGMLTKEEKQNLAFGAKLLTYEQSVRFLDDYIDGDNYYGIKSPTHNLERTRAQIQLLKSMEEQFSEMEKIVLEELN